MSEGGNELGAMAIGNCGSTSIDGGGQPMAIACPLGSTQAPLVDLRKDALRCLAPSTGTGLDTWISGDPAMCVVTSLDGTKAITGSKNGEIKVWDVSTGAVLRQAAQSPQDCDESFQSGAWRKV